MESITSVISKNYTKAYWIKAEMIKLNHYTKSNHCYPDMVEKEGSKIKAQIRTTLWSSTYFRINANFVKKTGKPLSDGMNLLFLAEVKHDALHGLSLNIIDIDADFEVGQLAKAKTDCINLLKKEKLFDKNRQLHFPLLPQRIAIISVNTSKGYQDFVNIIENNTRGYKFFYMLFPALLQGDAAVNSIIGQLDVIKRVKHHFDIVAIIRGGGGDVGLSCYDNYNLARNIAEFPLPVISGIGHSTNETVVEMVANYNPITPTDLAYFLQQKFDNIAVRNDDIRNSLIEYYNNIIDYNKLRIDNISKYISSKLDNEFKFERRNLDVSREQIVSSARNIMRNSVLLISEYNRIITFASKSKLSSYRQKVESTNAKIAIFYKNIISDKMVLLNHISEKVELLSPENVLKKGYSITMLNGKIVSDVNEMKEGDVLITKVLNGELKSKVTNIDSYE